MSRDIRPVCPETTHLSGLQCDVAGHHRHAAELVSVVRSGDDLSIVLHMEGSTFDELSISLDGSIATTQPNDADQT